MRQPYSGRRNDPSERPEEAAKQAAEFEAWVAGLKALEAAMGTIATFLAELDRKFDSLLLEDLLAQLKARHISK